MPCPEDRVTHLVADDVWRLFESNLQRAKGKLAELPVYCGIQPRFSGLSGWVFEQTIQHCIQRELKARRMSPNVREQVSLGGRTKADLVVGKVAVEIRTSGLFSPSDADRYKRYSKAAETRGFRYVYLTWEENFLPYKRALDKALGRRNVFYLNEDGEWHRFITLLVESNANAKG